MRAVVRLSAFLLISTLLASCGSGSSGVSKPAGRALALEVDAIRAAAENADRAATAAQLAQLRVSVTRLRASDDLSADAAARIRSAAARVEAQLDLLPAPTTTTTTTTISPATTAPTNPKSGNGRGHGNEDKDPGKKQGKTKE